MREIIFKGKRIDNGEWVEGDVHKNSDFSKAHIHPIGERVRTFDVIPETVSQYTGFLDKNGSKVFENDIVSYAWETNGCFKDKKLFFIEFKNGCYYFVPIKKRGEVRSVTYYENAEFEIVGNLYDNPEYLEGCEYLWML